MRLEEVERRRQEWKEQSKKRADIVDKMLTAYKNDDKELGNEYNDLLLSTLTADCEHGQTINNECSACDDIFKEVFPEHCLKCQLCNKLYIEGEQEECDCGGIIK